MSYFRIARYSSVLSLLFLQLCLSPARSQQPTNPEKLAEAGKTSNVPRSQSFHEDWTNLTLKNSTLELKLPTLLGKEDFPNKSFIRELYEVDWRPKDSFDLYVVLPRGVTHPPVILFLYTYPDDTQIYKNDRWCDGVTSGGYAAVGMVSALTGHRTRWRLGKEWFVSELQESLATTTHDVQLVLDYLAARGDLDMNRVGMFGVGSGGAITILSSAADSRIRAVDLLGPWGDWPGWLADTKVVKDDERANFLKPEFLAKVAPLDPVVWLPKVKAKSVRIQNVRTDLSMPTADEEKMEAAAPEFTVINQFGNKQSFLTNMPQPMLLNWLKDQLKPDAKPQAVVAKSERIHFFPPMDSPPQWSPLAPSSNNPKAKDQDKPAQKEKGSDKSVN